MVTGNRHVLSDIRPIVEEKIEQLGIEYQQIKGLILTESDLKCQLVCRLLNIRELSMPKKTENRRICSISVHSDLSWFDREGKLSITPDISIIEPEHLTVLRGHTFGLRLPSKGYAFSGSAIIFELKFIRHGLTDHIFKSQIMRDYDKIRGLRDRLLEDGVESSLFCYFVIFDKTNNACSDFRRFLMNNSEGDYYKFIYKTGSVPF